MVYTEVKPIIGNSMTTRTIASLPDYVFSHTHKTSVLLEVLFSSDMQLIEDPVAGQFPECPDKLLQIEWIWSS